MKRTNDATSLKLHIYTRNPYIHWRGIAAWMKIWEVCWCHHKSIFFNFIFNLALIVSLLYKRWQKFRDRCEINHGLDNMYVSFLRVEIIYRQTKEAYRDLYIGKQYKSIPYPFSSMQCQNLWVWLSSLLRGVIYYCECAIWNGLLSVTK